MDESAQGSQSIRAYPSQRAENMGKFLTTMENAGIPSYGHIGFGIIHARVSKHGSVKTIINATKDAGGIPYGERFSLSGGEQASNERATGADHRSTGFVTMFPSRLCLLRPWALASYAEVVGYTVSRRG